MKKLFFLFWMAASPVWAAQCEITSPLPMPIVINGCNYLNPLPGGSTSYVHNNSVNSSSVTFNTDSGTVTGAFTAGSVTDSGLTSGNCVQAGSGGLLTTVSGACSSGGGASTGTPNTSAYFSSSTLLTGATELAVITLPGSSPTSQFNLFSINKGTNSVTTLHVASPFFQVTGTVSTSGTTAITGTGTRFTAELAPGAYVDINGTHRMITSVTNDTSASVELAWGTNTNQAMFVETPPIQIEDAFGDILSQITYDRTFLHTNFVFALDPNGRQVGMNAAPSLTGFYVLNTPAYFGSSFGNSFNNAAIASIPTSASRAAAVFEGAASQSAPLFQLWDNGTSVIDSFDQYGNLTITPDTAAGIGLTVIGTNQYVSVFSTATSGSYFLDISSTGHINGQGKAPTPSSCGSTPSPTMKAGSTDFHGAINVGGGVVTSCILTFATPFTSAPDCITGDNSGSVTSGITSSSASSITITTSATLGGGVITYHCIGSD